jgi:hypothetical protein
MIIEKFTAHKLLASIRPRGDIHNWLNQMSYNMLNQYREYIHSSRDISAPFRTRH